jgi:hypothetical protein
MEYWAGNFASTPPFGRLPVTIGRELVFARDPGACDPHTERPVPPERLACLPDLGRAFRAGVPRQEAKCWDSPHGIEGSSRSPTAPDPDMLARPDGGASQTDFVTLACGLRLGTSQMLSGRERHSVGEINAPEVEMNSQGTPIDSQFIPTRRYFLLGR